MIFRDTFVVIRLFNMDVWSRLPSIPLGSVRWRQRNRRERGICITCMRKMERMIWHFFYSVWYGLLPQNFQLRRLKGSKLELQTILNLSPNLFSPLIVLPNNHKSWSLYTNAPIIIHIPPTKQGLSVRFSRSILSVDEYDW